VEETLRFLDRALPPAPARILEVGCGDGLVAAALVARGYDVTALDESLAAAAGAARVHFVEIDFLFYDPPSDTEPFDAVLFTRSLHHIASVDRALDRAAGLLRPGGRVVAEEFAVDRVTIPTARWWYDLQSVLVAAGILVRPDAALDVVRNPLGRWRQEHAHDPPLATGHAMLSALRHRFETGPAEEAPYLYRYVADRLVDRSSERSGRIVGEVHAIEGRLIRERDIAAAGIRIIGTLRA
jgi:SAM-dependent methyltransferase